MTFLAPQMLLGLLLVPIAIGFYLWAAALVAVAVGFLLSEMPERLPPAS